MKSSCARRPVLVRLPVGRGQLLLCTAPALLSNYGLLYGRNVRFAEGALAPSVRRRRGWTRPSPRFGAWRTTGGKRKIVVPDRSTSCRTQFRRTRKDANETSCHAGDAPFRFRAVYLNMLSA